MSKTRATYMTAEKAAIARENIRLYDWVREEVERDFLTPANAFVDKLDLLYDMVVAEGLPRSNCAGGEGDPDIFKCRVCGYVLGDYGWIVDPIAHPWKLKCPDCGRLFPTNDFGSFYKLGLNESGVFDRDLAHKKNDELIARGEPGYLVNELYPEMGPDWGVDDGFGYDTGRTYPNGIRERHMYIACYLHFALWNPVFVEKTPNKESNKKPGMIWGAIYYCAYAYFYTGDLKYGRVAAILLDRVADFYPDFDLYQYGKTIWHGHGGSNLGKICGRIIECTLAREFPRAYDMVFDVYEDEFVVNYLRKKSEQWKMPNPKNSAQDIRKNIEDRILRAMLDGLVDCTVSGNFGFPQVANAMLAVVLDDEVDTKKWLDYLMAPGWTSDAPCPGGGIFEVLADVIDADGQGNESSAYNDLWRKYLVQIADILSGYEGYPAADLYKNPKFLQMFYADLVMISKGYTAHIGDTGRTQGPYYWLKPDETQSAFRALGDYRFAQVLYLINGNTTEGLHDDITSPDPERLARDVQAVIDRYGPFQYESGLLTSFGYGALRQADHDLWMYFGANSVSHAHRDTLNIGMTAYGLNIMPELGYPEKTGAHPNRLQWIRSTLSHNTVMVDEVEQYHNAETRGKLLHFEDSPQVKLMDVSAPYVYPQCRQYRRTPVMIRVSEEEAYFADFFHVQGGNSHLFSLHAAADELGATQGLNLVPQVDENGEFVGSYAGPDVPFGEDPNSPASWYYDTKYPRGYTWTEHILRDENPADQVELDFPMRDFKNEYNVGDDLRLHVTSLNGQNRDNADLSISVVDGYPPRKEGNAHIKQIKYTFIHYKGENLDTVFTSVYEPYRKNRIIRQVTQLPMDNRSARGIKVELVNGRVDYIFYSNENRPIRYQDADVSICTAGFVSVYSYVDGQEVGRFVCDAERICGTVKDFTREQAEKNELIITTEQPVSDSQLQQLPGRVVVVDNGPLTRGGAYQICDARRQGNDLCLDLGRITLIRKYKDPNNFDAGFLYNIAQGQQVRIPL